MKLFGALLLKLTAAAALAVGVADVVPAELQFQLFVKILTFDRRLDRMGDEIVIAVVHQPEYGESVRTKGELIAAARASSVAFIEGRALRMVPVALDDPATLRAQLRDARADVAYLTPLRSVDVSALTQALAASGVLTLSGVPEHSEDGVAVAVGERAGRPIILIDRNAARAAGSEFGSQLLRLAEVR